MRVQAEWFEAAEAAEKRQGRRWFSYVNPAAEDQPPDLLQRNQEKVVLTLEGQSGIGQATRLGAVLEKACDAPGV